MARQKQIIAELKASGVDAREAQRTMQMLSSCLRVFENQWLTIPATPRPSVAHSARSGLDNRKRAPAGADALRTL